MKYFHRNTPVNPVITDKGNNVILYSSITPLFLADNSIRMMEVTVKNQTFLIECKQSKAGIETGILNLNGTPYEFVLKEAKNTEPAIILNLGRKSIDIEKSDKGGYFLIEESNNVPPVYKNYETSALVKEAMIPLANQIKDTIQNQNHLLEKSISDIKKIVNNQHSVLEEKIQKDLVNLTSNQQQMLKVFLQEALKQTDEKTTKLFEQYSQKTNKSISLQLEDYKNKILNDIPLTQINENSIGQKESAVTEKIQSLIKETFNESNNETSTGLKHYVDQKINQLKVLTLRLVETGGGSVAAQYAKGGVINGNLTVTGTLSAPNISSGPSIYTGTGTPEGVVSANQGSLYTDYSTGTVYIKSTAGGNTGWL